MAEKKNMENKVLELENKLREMEKKYNENRDILEDLIYHFMLEHQNFPRSNKKGLLKIFGFNYNYHEQIFGENYRDKLEKRYSAYKVMKDEKFEEEYYDKDDYVEKKIEEKINEMTKEECEKKLNEIFKKQFNDTIERMDDMEINDKREELIATLNADYGTEHGAPNWRYVGTNSYEEILIRGSEVLWLIFNKVKEKKELEKEQFINEILRPYIEKFEEIEQMIEDRARQRPEKLKKIKEKEAELERLKKEMDS